MLQMSCQTNIHPFQIFSENCYVRLYTEINYPQHWACVQRGGGWAGDVNLGIRLTQVPENPYTRPGALISRV